MGFHFEPIHFAIYMFVLAYSCILHECAHVWVALKLGDPTGKMEGRLTLDPRPHIDLYWTIILPALTRLLGGVAVGGPKPAPVNPLNFRDPRSGSMWTALAGPATNLVLVVLGFVLLLLLYHVVPSFVSLKETDANGFETYQITYIALFLSHVMFTNVMLTAFNLIPVPPLDGSRFLRFILGRAGEATLDRIERLGMIPILLAAYFLAPYAIGPFVDLFYSLLARVFSGGYAMALLKGYFAR